MIAGAGFALMARDTANDRSTRGILLTRIIPPRGHWRDAPGTPTREYYRILDRAEHAWNARSVADRWTI